MRAECYGLVSSTRQHPTSVHFALVQALNLTAKRVLNKISAYGRHHELEDNSFTRVDCWVPEKSELGLMTMPYDTTELSNGLLGCTLLQRASGNHRKFVMRSGH
jgi:hypothetical protein